MGLPINIKISNVLELACVIGGNVVIANTTLKSSPDNLQYFLNNGLGTILILTAIWLYHKERQHEIRANLIHGAFNALREIMQREAEQLAKMGETEKVEVIVNSLDKAPERFLKWLRELLKSSV